MYKGKKGKNNLVKSRNKSFHIGEKIDQKEPSQESTPKTICLPPVVPEERSVEKGQQGVH